MKRLLLFLIHCVLLFSTTFSRAETAHATLVCRSLIFYTAYADDSLGFEWRLNLSRFNAYVNSELSPNFLSGNYTFSAATHLYDDLYEETYVGTLRVNAPTNDFNGNGITDFLEIPEGVDDVITTALFNGITSIPVTWSRTAGSPYGSCTFRFPDGAGQQGEYMYFTHQFEIRSFEGNIVYTRESKTASGILDAVLASDPGHTLQGSIMFTNVSTNQLTLQSVLFTNVNLQVFDLYSTTLFTRNSSNYVGNVEYNDGDRNTPDDEDYYSWRLLIQDPNDTDGDHIPNLSDSLASVLPRNPSLSLTRGNTNLSLRISGDVGSMCQVQELISLGTTNWSNVLSLTLTNDPIILSVPFPSTMTRYWRALAN